MSNTSQAKLYSVTKPFSICLGMLTELTLEFREPKIRLQWLRVPTRNRPRFVVFFCCCIQTKSVLTFVFVEFAVAYVVYLNIFKEFLMRIFEDESARWLAISHRQSAFAYFFTLHFGTAGTLSFHEDGLTEAAMSLGHLIHLTLHHLISSFGSTCKMVLKFRHCLPFPGNCLAGTK